MLILQGPARRATIRVASRATSRAAVVAIALCAAALLPIAAQHARAQGPPPLARANQLFQAGQFDSAVAAVRVVLAGDSTNPRAWGLLGASLQAAGHLDEALEVNRHAADMPAARPNALYRIGLVYGAKGNLDSAFTYLQIAKATGKVNLADIDIDPNAAPLRKDPRYRALKPSADEFAKPFAEPFTIIGEWRGTQMNEQFGWIARDIGDVDGDHVHDFVTSAPGHETDGPNAGAVFVYSSKSGKLLWKVEGRKNDGLGQGIEAAGDVNRDGIPDVIASAPGNGRAYLYSGRDGRLLRTFVAEDTVNDAFGTHVAGVGDVNHDGYADVIVGAPAHNKATGRAYVYSGKDGAVLLTLSGAESGEQYGSSVSGWADKKNMVIVAGAPGGGARKTGRAYVYESLTSRPAFTLDSDSTGAALGGMFVAVPGDMDRDGKPDVFVSDWNNSAKGRSTGRTYVLSGGSGKPLLTLTGETAGDGFGTSASVAGDVNHDGYADLIIGAWQHASKAISGGKVYLYSGKDGTLLRTWTGQVPGETLGFDAVGIGDVNGDGAIDFLLTSGYSAIGGSHSGRVFIVAGDKKY